jgi:hypothetical protein
MSSKKLIYDRSSCRITHWGCSFDSLLELRFALSIQDEFEFLRSPVSVYYDPTTKQAVDHIRLCTRRYTPDFLIRHEQTKVAQWVEIKPRAFADHASVASRKSVAENYIRWKGYDWEYKIVFDDEIHLTAEQEQEFERCCQLKYKSAGKLNLQELNNVLYINTPTLFSRSASNKKIEFVMFGENGKRKGLE